MLPTSFRFGRSIGQRMLIVFSLVLALSLTGAGLGVWALSGIERETRALVEGSVVTERLASDWQRLIKAGVLRTTAVAMSSDATLADFFAAETAESSRQSSALQKTIEPLMRSAEEKRLYAAIGERRSLYLKARDRIVAVRRSGDVEAVKQVYVSEFKPSSEAYLGELTKLLDLQRQEIDTVSAELVRVNGRARLSLIVFGLAATALGLLLSVWLSRNITGALRQAADAADAIARFDLRSCVVGHDRDEAGRLLQSLARMQDALSDIVQRVRGSTQSVAVASEQIASGNSDLSQRTEQTASRLQHTAGSMVQLTGSVRQTADSAHEANQLAALASGAAGKGGAVVAQVVRTMQEINASSQRIADIIGVIDGIAFQTNILALNAAVEAARAGEQGRGFAVVAGEVRALAQRSAAAAKEIKQLIDDSVGRVGTGTELVQQAGTSMGEIVDSVRRVTDIIAEISAAASEQSRGIGEVGEAVSHLDEMTQQNAALVEQAAAASSSLHDQADKLSQAVAVFKVGT